MPYADRTKRNLYHKLRMRSLRAKQKEEKKAQQTIAAKQESVMHTEANPSALTKETNEVIPNEYTH